MFDILLGLAFAANDAPHADVQPIACLQCEAWNRDVAPFRILGNTYYVGVEGLSAVLITGDDGHVLIDGGLPQSAPLIAEHVEVLGFKVDDIRLILNSHAHFDHAGGIAALARLSGAEVAMSGRGAEGLRAGNAVHDDPQAGYGNSMRFPAVERVRVIADGQVLRVGKLELTAHATPGHTPGGMSYTWQGCDGGECFEVVYADSLTAVAAPGYRYADHPDVLGGLRKSIDVVRTLPCDVLVSAHPSASKLFERRDDSRERPFVEPKACGEYGDAMSEWLERRLAEEAEPATAG